MCRQCEDRPGITALLSGHTDIVNAVCFFPADEATIILSGSVDRTVRVWRESSEVFKTVALLQGHQGSINCLAAIAGSQLIATGAADATFRIWYLSVTDNSICTELLHTIQIAPRFFPLALTFSHVGQYGALILAIGGTKSIVQIYVTESGGRHANFIHRATLSGHEGWIRSLEFVAHTGDQRSDLLLASASQDKYIRLWRVRGGESLPTAVNPVQDPSSRKLLSNKAHRFEAGGKAYSLSFEALLHGHEDWIYTAVWCRERGRLQLLSASADNSLAIWECDPTSGVWLCSTRLGEISAQKGSTTATGSTGGFWIGLWSPNGESVVSLARTGSWRRWNYHGKEDRWTPAVGISGHIKDVKSIAWAKDGTYLLSTSSDQTTRLHAEWRRGTSRSWHEFARPQIHGYDLNCIDTIGQSQFISGADEKLLRVFNKPRAVARMLETHCRFTLHNDQEMADAANMPVLGLSNKAIDVGGEIEQRIGENNHEPGALQCASVTGMLLLNAGQPPFEDQLARHTLWPEREKLYGHGFEISAVTTSHDGQLVATACKASSTAHAVIRLYKTREWREIKPALVAHSLTVTCLKFSDDDNFLLSVGRDRQWTIFDRDATDLDIYTLRASNPKAHSRMILAAAWGPSVAGKIFATAGRDKLVRLWGFECDVFVCQNMIQATSAVTSVEFLAKQQRDTLILAMGTEDGGLMVHVIETGSLALRMSHNIDRR